MEKITTRGKALNDDNGKCRTLKSQYQKNSLANFVRGGTFGATASIKKIIRKDG